jgi:hypothetical protein
MRFHHDLQYIAWAAVGALSACSAGSPQAPPVFGAGANLDAAATADAGASATVHDAGATTDAGSATLNNPLAAIARDETWHFVPFADAYCANGSSTGIGVNLTNASDDLLIFLSPGGACWDQQTCKDSCAINMASGYDENHGTPTWSAFGSGDNGTIFDRTDTQNPLRNYNYAFIFYCTGDNHTGSRIDASVTVPGLDGGPQPVHFLGYQNLLTYLKAFKATFSPQSVAFFGASAGGFGVYIDYDTVARTFHVPVYMIDDSGPYLQTAYWPADSGTKLAEAWGLRDALAGYLSSTYPQGRMALLTSTQDGEISQRFQMDGGNYEAALDAYATDVLAPLPNWRYFYLAGNTHTAIEGTIANDTPCGRGITSVSGLTCAPTLQQFISEEMSGPLASWKSATPPAGASGTVQVWGDHWYCALGQ